MTDDELRIMLLDAWRQILKASENLDSETVDPVAREVKEIEARIVAVARKQASPEYAAHLADLRKSWGQRSPGVEYVCDLFDTCRGYDWEWPNVMERRRALRERPDIAALLASASSLANAGDDHG